MTSFNNRTLTENCNYEIVNTTLRCRKRPPTTAKSKPKIIRHSVHREQIPELDHIQYQLRLNTTNPRQLTLR